MEAIINKLYQQESLTEQESQQLFDTIIRGELDPILMAATLTALKIKGETPDEIAGAAKALLANPADTSNTPINRPRNLAVYAMPFRDVFIFNKSTKEKETVEKKLKTD